MKVWVVIFEHCGDCGQVEKVFATPEGAESYASKQLSRLYRVEEWMVQPSVVGPGIQIGNFNTQNNIF